MKLLLVRLLNEQIPWPRYATRESTCNKKKNVTVLGQGGPSYQKPFRTKGTASTVARDPYVSLIVSLRCPVSHKHFRQNRVQ